MKSDNLLYKIFKFYYEGFCNMKLGRTLWAIILLFVVLKVFFFPDFLKEQADGNEAEFVATQILNQ